MITKFKNLGPGLLFAGAAIGVSHLVQSTRAGADFGLGLIWALLLVNLCKYPFFQYGPRYSLATDESLLDGYKKLGKWVLMVYLVINFATMFTIQTAVTIVTAGLASSLFGDFISVEIWTIVIVIICFCLLIVGKYKLLDKLMKIIVITLTLSTVIAVIIAHHNNIQELRLTQIFPNNTTNIAFLIAFMGWMPAPLDVSVWQSLWCLEKNKETVKYTPKKALFDFNIGYVTTIFIGIGFVLLGTYVMFQSGQTFSNSAGQFANQLVNMYTISLGNWAYIIIGVAAFTTMFSTTLTTLDASPRTMASTIALIFNKPSFFNYHFWIVSLSLGTIMIFLFLASEMAFLITIATILSFLTAPFFAILNYVLISSKHTPKEWHPSKIMHLLSWLGVLFLIGFSVWYLTTL